MKEKQTIGELLAGFETYLIALKRSRFTLRQYKQVWKLFQAYCTSHHIQFYDRSVGDQFIASQLGNYNYADLTQMQRRLVNTIDALYVFQKEGALHMGPAPLKRKPPREFEGEIGLVMASFINYKKTVFDLAKTTLK